MTDLSIGDLAARFGIATHVLRHWEDMGLLSPRRDSGGRRRYSPADTETVGLILVAKRVGMSLDEIRALSTATADRESRRKLLRAHQDRLEEQIAWAQAAMATIGHAADCTAENLRECPNFRALLARAVPER
ncbi:MerR family transcriptional regulator [Nocardia wallacei]|uniref:MerR family transcriptional regulator n=1 Tax=Nocardia TaxID=1817 RepID=UPI00245462A9|nr:MerR family transcriptional regulator [Nocardia wallacei]